MNSDCLIDCRLPTNTIHYAVLDVFFCCVKQQKVILIVINYFIFCGNYN